MIREQRLERFLRQGNAARRELHETHDFFRRHAPVDVSLHDVFDFYIGVEKHHLQHRIFRNIRARVFDGEIVGVEIIFAGVNDRLGFEWRSVFFDDIFDVEQSIDHARMNFVIGMLSEQFRVVQRVTHIVRKIEFAVALGFPARVHTIDIARRRAIQNNRPHDANAPRINDALDLNHFVRGASDEHIKFALTRLRHLRERIEPIAKNARAVS